MATVKKSQGFSIIEVLIASAIGLITLGVIYGAYQAGWKTFQFNQKRMDVINKLSLSIDGIKKEAREGKKFKSYEEFANYGFSVSIPSNSLIFTTSDTMVVVFYISKEESSKDDVMEDVLHKMVFDISTQKMVEDRVITRKEISSSDPDASEFELNFNISDSSADITLTAKWTYRNQPEKSKSMSSVIHLRNWGR